jgi:hypothetical protein
MNEAVIEIGGQRRELKYGVLAIQAIEKETGKSVYQLFHEFTNGPLPIHLGVAIVWGGLLRSLPGVKLPMVANWLDDCDFREVVSVALAAFGEALARTLKCDVPAEAEEEQEKN